MPRRKPFKFANWGKPRARRRLIYFFAHLGLTFSVALLIILVGAGILLLSSYIRSLIEHSITSSLVNNLTSINNQAPAASPQSPATTTVSGSMTSAGSQAPTEASFPPNLLYSTFYFGFSGTPWLDESATTMFRDNNEATLIFPPKYSWQETNAGDWTSDGSPTSQTLSGVTAKVIQDGASYKVLLTAPDGSAIWTASSTPLVSEYSGTVGLGGTPDDFLLVYGAFKGSAYEVKKSAAGVWSWTDVSIYFPYRVMHSGFAPAVIKLGDSTPQFSSWYVYSLTPGNPKLIKLFSDPSGKIIGAVDFTPLLFPSGVASAEFGSPASGGSGTSQILSARVVDTGGVVHYYQFTDNGFETSGSYTVESANINNYPWPVYGVKLTSDFGSLNGVPTQFLVSNDGVNWQSAAVGEETVFQNTSGTELLWKAVFTPPSGSSVSPFLGDIRLDFQVVRPQ